MFLIIWYKALYSFDQDSDSFLYLPLNASSTVKATLVAPAKTVIVHYERVEEDSDLLVHVDQTIFAGWISKEKFSYHPPTVQVTTLWHFQKSQAEERSGHQYLRLLTSSRHYIKLEGHGFKMQKNCPTRDLYLHCGLENIGRIQLSMMMQSGVLTIP